MGSFIPGENEQQEDQQKKDQRKKNQKKRQKNHKKKIDTLGNDVSVHCNTITRYPSNEIGNSFSILKGY